MAIADFWEIKDNQVFGGKPILNVYHVKRIKAGANATDVANAFIDSVIEAQLKAIQPATLARTTIDVRNLGEVTDFITVDSSVLPGTLTGEYLPSFNSATIQLSRTRTDMKNGSKSFFVGNEAKQVDGAWIAGFLTTLGLLGDALVTPWEETTAPGIDVCELVVLKRFCVVPAEDPCTKYRLPINSAEIDANHYVPLNTVVRTRVRSQVSRKILN